jgi:phosphoserine aminotransferase
MLDFKTHADNGSMYNTPPCWAIYMCGLVFKHLIKLGGIEGGWRRRRGG